MSNDDPLKKSRKKENIKMILAKIIKINKKKKEDGSNAKYLFLS